MRSRILKILAVVVVILLPFIVPWIYFVWTALPAEITIATGPELGEWEKVSRRLQTAVVRQLEVSVNTHDRFTEGSMQHLQLLQGGDVDFALYLRGSLRSLSSPDKTGPEIDTGNVAFVANLYSDVTLFLVRREIHDAGQIRTPEDLRRPPGEGRRWRVAVGAKGSGEYQINQIVLEHYNISDEYIDARNLHYPEIEAGFDAGQLDAALMTARFQAPVFEDLLLSGRCSLAGIPETAAITMRNPSLTRYSIPAGLYRSGTRAVPEKEIETIASRTQLLTRADAPTRLVQEVTKLILGQEFIRQNRFTELDAQGLEFARRDPAFPVHPGARQVYEPHMRPFVNPDFMEATENLRSFAVSLLIAGFLVFRWWHKRLDRKREHKLDNYIAKLLKIDAAQVTFDEGQDDERSLQEALDAVTTLRHQALREFSAREMSDEPGVDCFLSLCHSVSEKISGKLVRQRLDRRSRDLARAINAAGSDEPEAE